MQKILMAFVITAVLIGPIVMQDASRLAHATPVIQLVPNSGSPGESVSYTISGVAPNAQYTIQFAGVTIASGVTDPTGASLTGSFIVPETSGGIVTFGYDDVFPGDKVSTEFTVLGSSATASVQGSVTIAGTCGITTTGGSLQYGTLIPGAISPEQTLTLQNTGTVSASLFVSGTDWTAEGSTTSEIDAANTKWSITSGTDYAGKTALTTSPAMMTSTLDISPSTLPTYWQLQANLNHGTFTGALTQTVLLSVSC